MRCDNILSPLPISQTPSLCFSYVLMNLFLLLLRKIGVKRTKQQDGVSAQAQSHDDESATCL